MEKLDINQEITYGTFHFMYLGYDFKSKSSGIVYTKGRLWDAHRQIAIDMVKKNEVNNNFIAIDHQDWKNGHLKH
jgi:hypothetical protein